MLINKDSKVINSAPDTLVFRDLYITDHFNNFKNRDNLNI